ncbi:putative geranyl diphosphate diphosphatase [Helianthus annuus]|nr:putative geranyl diphosphate diphosphatase [Helianthus annuus]
MPAARWWRDLGLASKLTFARDRPIECFLWSVGLLPEPKYSTVRIELAKTVSILLVIDDVFDTYGTYDDLVLFTKAIQRWDVDEIEQLPEYMKICYMALHNTTNEICDVVHKNHGLSVLPYLRKAWIDTIQAFMVEAEWVKRGYEPDLKDYIDNGITTAGTYMALVHLFFLMGEGVTPKNMSSLLHSYPPFFTHAGKILRLWDDLGTSKEEQERGDIASSVQLLMKEKNIKSEEDGRKQILELIQTSWKELNEALVAPNIFPFSIVNVALNMSRASQVVYQHDDGNSYFSSVDDHARSLFFTPIDM